MSKIYKLYNTPVDRMKEALHWRGKKYHKDFHALNNISFVIKKGETVGIIGKNGSGKSTLLKIITGVLSATLGTVSVNGRISALLELGAGFNPEYTGIENIYFQGSLMGYSTKELDVRIQNILSFADIGEFIHQPVKMYSSGMFARLAFAVAINVEPDILIVDEALSVGDAAFQNKCMRKMEEIRKNGVTILFVSHDTQAIAKFCKRSIWLNAGFMKEEGLSEFIIPNYLSFMNYGMEMESLSNAGGDSAQLTVDNAYNELINVVNLDSFGEKHAFIEQVGFVNVDNSLLTSIVQGEWVTFVCDFYTDVDLHDIGIGVLFTDRLNTKVFSFNSYMYNSELKNVNKNSRVRTSIKFKMPKLFPQDYTVAVALSEGTQDNHIIQHWIHTTSIIKITSKDFIDASIVAVYPDEIDFTYRVISIEDGSLI